MNKDHRSVPGSAGARALALTLSAAGGDEVAAARAVVAGLGERVEVDDDADVSRGDGGVTWVQAWVRVAP